MGWHGSGTPRRIPERGKAVAIAVVAVLATLVSYGASVISTWWPPPTAGAPGPPPLWHAFSSAGYGCGLLAGAALGYWVFFTPTARRVAWAAVVASAVVILAQLGETALALAAGGDAAGGGAVVVAEHAVAAIKWSLLFPAAVVAALGVGTTLRRASRRRALPSPTVSRPTVDEDPAVERTTALDEPGPHDQRASWRANSLLPGADRSAELEGPAGQIGFCVSGGGIRAATLTLGALDSMREVLVRARWLVSVSGGGYATGAMRLALQRLEAGAVPDPDAGWRSVAQPRDVYRCGSSELDYTRRHGRYLADGAREWVTLAVTVARGFLVNVATLGLVVVLVGRVIAHLYAWVAPGRLTSWPPASGPLVAIGFLTAVWLLMFTAAVMIEPAKPAVTRALRATGASALMTAALVALAGVGLPLLAWSVIAPPSWVTWGSPTVTLAGGYLAALIALGKQASTRAAVSKAVTGARKMWRTAGASGRNYLATLLVYAGLLVVLSGYALLFAVVLAHTGAAWSSAVWFSADVPEWLLTAGVAVAVGLLAMVDQVRWSLHPFYRRRLASAFAVRRLRRRGRVAAEPYDYDVETTYLHRYGTKLSGFPEVIFSCAAHVSGQKVAPPGRRVVPWTLSASYVGGQSHGWVATGQLCRYVAPALQHDLTVQGAQAVSGAALASQMGAAQRVYAKFLTLTNIRLGSWLPNPAYLHELPAPSDPDAWAWPQVPRRRRLTTLLREFVGSFPAEHPLVYVTDGGHYENLGLVELLRRRPAVVYCLDASGDLGDAPHTLARAVQLAYEELGVRIDLPDVLRLGAGPDQRAPEQAPQLIVELADRIAADCVVTGTIGYPDLGPGLPEFTGRIIVGKAALTARTPFPLLTYAGEQRSFPTDAVSDQWFDVAQFDAYHSLGRHIGEVMLTQPVLPTEGDQRVAAAHERGP
ncbi:MAG TPA: hypothetical protein VGI84_09965 [Pseudonocardiaceae bacterium]